MSKVLDMAIERIRSVGDRLCENQVYYFDDYDFDPETGVGDATALCNRLGIPVTDDIVIEYPAKRTFGPLPELDISAFEQSLEATLPTDYKRLLATFGAFHLPGNADICISSPSSAISSTCGAWWFDDPSTMPVPGKEFGEQETPPKGRSRSRHPLVLNALLIELLQLADIEMTGHSVV